MIERLTDEMITKDAKEYVSQFDLTEQERANIMQNYRTGAEDCRNYYETILKDLFYITPMEWEENDLYLYAKPDNHSTFIIEKENSTITLWDSVNGDSKYVIKKSTVSECIEHAESHRMEQMIAQGLKKVEI